MLLEGPDALVLHGQTIESESEPEMEPTIEDKRLQDKDPKASEATQAPEATRNIQDAGTVDADLASNETATHGEKADHSTTEDNKMDRATAKPANQLVLKHGEHVCCRKKSVVRKRNHG